MRGRPRYVRLAATAFVAFTTLFKPNLLRRPRCGVALIQTRPAMSLAQHQAHRTFFSSPVPRGAPVCRPTAGMMFCLRAYAPDAPSDARWR